MDSAVSIMREPRTSPEPFPLWRTAEEEKEHFTLVLISMLRLQAVRDSYMAVGAWSRDYVAREPFWSRGLNFDHGTGHGVGYLSSVHERPNGIRFKMVPERHDNGILRRNDYL